MAPPAPAMTVLILEDEALTALGLGVALSSAGHRVLGPFDRVDEAFDAALRARPDLALIDINLGRGDDGLDLVQVLLAATETLPVLTTADPRTAREEADSAAGLVAKPFSTDAIVRVVETIGRLSRGEDPGRMPRELELFRAVPVRSLLPTG